MKVSVKWLQTYFDSPLPAAEQVADALTFHAFEVEEQRGDYMEVNVLPDRACYALSQRGVASELSAVLRLPMKQDPLRMALPAWSATSQLVVDVDPAFVLRHTGALVRGVTVGPSPAWLVEALEAIGQRSINNIVDATNYVMNNIGQPMHAFDAGKIARDGDMLHIDIRRANEGEKITILTGEEFELSKDLFVIADATSGTALDIAGLKGGAASGITSTTTDLFVSVGNYDGTTIRRMSQTLKLVTDASVRYQNRPSPELTAYGMRDILALITDIAGGEVDGVVDVYPNQAQAKLAPVNTSLEKINTVLGTSFTAEQVEDVFGRLGFSFEYRDDGYVVTPPFERRDITIAEDVAEEVGRIIGYDTIPSAEFQTRVEAVDQARYRGIERIKDFLVERGFTEISTQSFAATGEIALANPLDQTCPYLRANLTDPMRRALARAVQEAPRVLGPVPYVKLFEIGTVFTSDGERLELALGYQSLSGKKDEAVLGQIAEELGSEYRAHVSLADAGIASVTLSDLPLESLGTGHVPQKVTLSAFRPFSVYPFALRDIAVWTPSGTEQSEVENVILAQAGDLLVRVDLFDRFEKEGRISYAFRLVFESMERTLSDADISPAMEKITAALTAHDAWEVR